MAAGRKIRLYEVTVSSGQETDTWVYGCLKPSGHPFRLGPRHQDSWGVWMPGPFAISAPWAAGIEVRQTGLDTDRIFTASRNLRTGFGHHCEVGGADRPGQMPRVRKILVARDGIVVWAAVMHLYPQGPEIGVCEADGPSVVDHGEGLELDSVALHGSTLSWLHSGVRHSTELP
jgi:hypothetical protein